MGFCRTNLFKRLESSGQAFMQSVERHILRNFVYLHALENNQSIPIGTQAANLLDTRFTDADQDLFTSEDDDNNGPQEQEDHPAEYRSRFPPSCGRSLCPVCWSSQATLSLAAD